MAAEIPAVFEAANVYRAVIDQLGNRLIARPLLELSTGFTVTDEAETATLGARTKVVLDSASLGVLTVTPQAPLSNTGDAQNVVLEIAAASGATRGTMSTAHFTLVDGATSNSTANRLVKRDGLNAFAVGSVALDTSLSIGTPLPAGGAIKLQNGLAIKARNAGDSADVDMLSVDAADKLQIGDATDAAGMALSVNAANSVDFTFGANVRLSVKDAALEFAASGTATIRQADATAGAGGPMSFTAQTAFAGVGGEIRVTTGRGATNADQCGALTFNTGDNTTDSAITTWATRTLGNILTVQYLGATTATWLKTPAGSGKGLGFEGANGVGINATAGSVYLLSNSNPRIQVDAAGVGFNGFATSYPTINGAKGGNVALGNLLTALAAMGLIIDATTP